MRSDEQLIAELEQATDGLLFMSESDYPFETLRWEGLSEITPQHLRETAGVDAETQITSQTVEDFFRVAMAEQSWKGAQELAAAKKYQALVRLLKENLEDLKAYRVGEINIPVFIVGKSKTGNWLGVSTRVVET